jgi:ABC-2 type transport system ATP-binding protein
MSNVISAKDITYSYDGKKPAVDKISFDLGEGEILGFLGPNGAGKSTTVKMLIGLLSPQSGDINIFSKDVKKEINTIHSQIGVCFEEKNLYEDMSAASNLKFFASLFGEKKFDPSPLLERVGLPTDRKDKTGNFSKGMKQRLMVARSLVNNPKILFLDEPTEGLDPVSSEAIRNVILQEKKKGTAVFLTTHDMMEADKLSDRVAFVNEGKIAVIDTPDNLKHQYGKRVLRVRYDDHKKVETKELSLDSKDTGEKINEIMHQYSVKDMHTEEATLEDIFIKVTGRKL